MAYPWFRPYQDKYQSGVAFRVAILGDSDFSSSDSWVSKLRSQLTTRNPNCIVTDYSVVGLTAANALSVVSDIVDDTADVCLVCLGISDFSVIDHGQFGLNCVAIGDALNTGGIYPIFVQGNDIQTVTGYQGQTSEWFCMYMNALDQVAVHEGREYHTLNGYSQFRHLKEQGTLGNYLASNTRMNAAGHDLLLGKIAEWFFAPEIFIWKNNSEENYILGAREATVIANPSGDGDYWYSTGGSLRHATLSGPNWATVSSYTTITYTNQATLNAAYPAIFINPRDGWYYLFGGGTIELYPDNFYLWKSPNGVTNWQYANNGAPVLTRGANGPWSHIWNGTIIVELKDSAANDVFHLLIDGSPMDRAHPELNNYGMLYSSATLGGNFNFDTNKSAGYVKQNWGTPQVLHVPERNAVLVFYMDLGYIIDSPITNGFDTPGRNGFCTIRVGWCDLSNGYSAMSTPANWHESPLLNIQEANEHITDPTICVMPSGKDSKLCLGYYWGQSNSRNIFTYSDYTPTQLYDLVAGVPTESPLKIYAEGEYRPVDLHYWDGTQWAIMDPADIQAYLAGEWQPLVAGGGGTPWSITHDLSAVVSTSLTVTHDVQAQVSTALTHLHDAAAQISSGYTITHDTRVAVATAITILHDTLADISALVGYVVHHDTRVVVSTQIAQAHDALARIASEITTTHDTRVVVQLLDQSAQIVRMVATLSAPGITFTMH